MGNLQLVAGQILAIAVLTSGATAGEQPPQSPELLEGFLHRTARRFDCYFTVEQVQGLDSPEFLQKDGFMFTDFASLEEALTALRKKDSEVTFSVDKQSSRVVHIVQAGCLKASNRGLERTIGGFSFVGTPFELGNRLEAVVGQIKSQRCFSYPGPSTDIVSRITVSEFTGAVRDLLTLHLPLSDYSRVLWVGTTDVDTGVTEIRFQARGTRRPDKRWIPRLPEGIRGEDEFEELDWLRSQIIKLATKEIEEGGKQPRWAMRVLGRYRAGEGVPALMKAIDWEYTYSALIQERYPAIWALTEIGVPAVNPIATRLAVEEDGLAQKLLCYTLRGILDKKRAAETLRHMASAQKDVKKSQRLADALTLLESLPD